MLTGWRLRAACQGLEDLFEVESKDAGAEALAICCGCPVLPQCREWAEQFRWAGVVIGGRRFGIHPSRWKK